MAQRISLKKAAREWKLYLLVAPSLLMVAVFAYYPAASALYHSFFDWAGHDTKEFVGLGNFARATGDPVFRKSFFNISVLVIANVVKMIPSILLAVLIHRIRNDGARYWYRVAVVVPMIVPGIVTLFIWKFFYDPNYGVLNALLDTTGGKDLLVWLDGIFGWELFYADVPIGWLSTPELILPSLIFWGFPWVGNAMGILIYLAGLQAIDKELYEAAELDGAGPIRQFLHIELPLILTQVRLMLILMVINTLQGYGQQFLLLGESGGPDRAGMTPGLWMFNRAFFNSEFGYACALGVFIFAFILALTWINNKFVRVEK